MTFVFVGDAGGTWTLVKQGSGWRLFEGPAESPQCTVRIDQDKAWRLFTKGIAPLEAAKCTAITGAEALGAPFLNTLAIVAAR